MLAVVGALPLTGDGAAAVLNSVVISRFALIFSMVVLVSFYVLQLARQHVCGECTPGNRISGFRIP